MPNANASNGYWSAKLADKPSEDLISVSSKHFEERDSYF
jgi:hypothetical protein